MITNEEAAKKIEQQKLEFLENYVDYGSVSDAYDIAITAIKKQIPVVPYQDNENGIYEDDCCPTCHRKLFPYEHHCRCGQAINWEGM